MRRLRTFITRHFNFATPAQIREMRELLGNLAVQNVELGYALDVERVAHVTLYRELCKTCRAGLSRTYRKRADAAVDAYAQTHQFDEELEQLTKENA